MSPKHGKNIFIGLFITILCFIFVTAYVGSTATGEAQVRLILATKYLRENQYQEAILSYGEGIAIAYKQSFDRFSGHFQGDQLTGCYL